MFTLGNKEAIVNSVNNFKITNAGVTTWAANVATMAIYGFGTFHKDQIVSAVGKRYEAGVPGALRIETPSAAELGLIAGEVNIPVVVHIRMNSSRDASEWANDFIKRGRPIIFEINVSYGDTEATVKTTLLAAFAAYEKAFTMAPGLPFTYSDSTVDDASVTLIAKADDLSFSLDVEFLRRRETWGIKAKTDKFVNKGVTGATALANATTIPMTSTAGVKVGDILKIYDDSANAFLPESYPILTIASSTTVTIAAPGFTPALQATDIVFIEQPGNESTNSGKYLEENVRMATENSAFPYSIGAGEIPIVTGKYSSISWVAKAADGVGVAKTWQPHKNLAIVSTDAQVGTMNQTFTMYFNEDSTLLASGGVVEILVNWLIDTTPVVASDFIKANKVPATDGASFVA